MKSPKNPGYCLACGARLSEPIFTLDNMPVGAQAMPLYEELSEDKGVTLPLCRCEKCGLVQFDCEPVDYYRDAIRVVGLSETMQELRRSDYRYLIDNYALKGKKWIECGCGNGDFLKVLTEFPVDIYGTEAGEAGIEEAREKLCRDGNIDESHIMSFFPENADMEIPGGPFDCFLSFNFLEHQPDPKSMLGCLYNNLADGGIGIITVPSFEYILEKGSYYELIRDHIANYDMYSLERLVISCGFSVLEKERIGIGDTLRMVVKKADNNKASVNADGISKKNDTDTESGYTIGALSETSENVTDRVSKKLPDNGNGDNTENINKRTEDKNDKYRVLAYNYLMMKQDIAGYMEDLGRNGRSIALWGAGHQGFTIASTTALKDNVRYIIDSSPKKYGRFAPASHLRIVPPDTYFEHPVDVIMIAAPGYIKEIEKTIREMYGVHGKDPGVPAICDVTDMTER